MGVVVVVLLLLVLVVLVRGGGGVRGVGLPLDGDGGGLDRLGGTECQHGICNCTTP